jgi:hypothetical protein
MKYHEVRFNNGKFFYRREIYNGDFILDNFLEEKEKDLFVPKFERNDNGSMKAVSFDLLIKEYPEFSDKDFDYDNSRKSWSTYLDFLWVFKDSDHRKDVRIVNDNILKELKNRYIQVPYCEHIYSEHTEFFKTKKMLATKAYHKLGDISREKPSLCIVNEADEDNYYGQWESGFGFINVRFPKETTKEIECQE